MLTLLQTMAALLRDRFRSRLSMQVEVLALRHQLAVYQRTAVRPRVQPADRILWSWFSRHCARWREVLVFVQPAVSPAGEDRHRMATTPVPMTLDQAEYARRSGPTRDSKGDPRSDPANVYRQFTLGSTSDRRRAGKA